MSRGVELVWAGGEDRFLLTLDHMRALQDRCDAGPAWILARLGSNQWRVDDVVSTIRLSLEGGGVTREDARKRTKIYVEDRPLTESVLLASTILAHALYGAEDDPLGEAKTGTESPAVTRSQEGDGNSLTSSNGRA